MVIIGCTTAPLTGAVVSNICGIVLATKSEATYNILWGSWDSFHDKLQVSKKAMEFYLYDMDLEYHSWHTSISDFNLEIIKRRLI